MVWFKVDDSFYDHPKVFDAPDCAVALWVRAGTWSARNLTDGFVPARLPARFCDDPDTALRVLIDRGLWRRTKRGYQFHDWQQYQPSAEQVRELSRKRAEAGRRGGQAKAHRHSQANATASANLANHGLPELCQKSARKTTPEDKAVCYETEPGESPGHGSAEWQNSGKALASAKHVAKQNSAPYPYPYPDKSSNEDLASAAKPQTVRTVDTRRPDVEQLCERLRERVQANGAKAKITERWRTQARLLLDRDERPLSEALALIDWCAAHPFWCSNVLSVPKFREKYDQLRLQAANEHNTRRAPSAASQTIADLERGMTPEDTGDVINGEVVTGIERGSHER